jgi:hypothetical protein
LVADIVRISAIIPLAAILGIENPALNNEMLGSHALPLFPRTFMEHVHNAVFEYYYWLCPISLFMTSPLTVLQSTAEYVVPRAERVQTHNMDADHR